MTHARNAIASFVALASACAAALVAAPVAAHGNPPAAGQIAVDPGDASRIWMRTNFGIITSDDGGGAWRWICAESAGYDANVAAPPLVLMAGGSALLGTFDGIVASADGCDFAIAGAATENVIDLQRESDPSQAIALSAVGVALDTFDVKLWHTATSGASWTSLGAAPPADFLASSLALAPSDPQRVYLVGRDGAAGAYAGALMRSDDRGASWLRHWVPGTDGMTAAYAAAVDPNHANRVFVAIRRASDYFAVLHSSDGGESFTKVFARNSPPGGFALSPDGAAIAVGGPLAGLWVADTSTLVFQQTNDIVVKCLWWEASGLYACAEELVDGYLVGVSQDEGATFAPLATQSSACGPPERCGATTSVGAQCPALWTIEQRELDACPDDGSGGASGVGGAAHGGGHAEGGSGGSAALSDGSPSGCACSSAAPARGAWWLGLAPLLWVRRRGTKTTAPRRATARAAH